MKMMPLLILLALLVASPSVAQTPVYHYRLDGNAQDAGASAQHGTPVGTVTWATSGRIDGAVSLAGAGHLALPNLNVTGSALTLSAWINPSSAATTSFHPRIVTKSLSGNEQDHWWMLSLVNIGDGQTRPRVRVKTAGVTTTLYAVSGAAVPLNTWSHVAATYDGAAIRLYLNGAQVGSVSKTGTLSTSTTVPVNIGRSPDDQHYFRGMIDDVRIYNTALTTTAIQALATGGTTPPPPPPVEGETVPAGQPFKAAADHGGATAEAPVDGFRCYLDRSVWSTLPLTALQGGTFLCDYPGLSPGEHIIQVSAFNTSGEGKTPELKVTALTETLTLQPPGKPVIR